MAEIVIEVTAKPGKAQQTQSGVNVGLICTFLNLKSPLITI